ncbi:MAG: carboxypeptidase-like regulatory domain-containing protein [Marinilabiliales bacterium]
MIITRTAYILFLLLLGLTLSAQKYAVIKGKVINEDGMPVSNVNVFSLDTQYVTVTNNAGHYRLNIPANKKIVIRATHLEYIPFQKEIYANEGEVIDLDIVLKVYFHEINMVTVEDFGDRVNSITRIDPKEVEKLPGPDGSLESILSFTATGVSHNSELSSQYSVRGGNFDENLVYVNGIEVYRPILTRSGQQEGLSFINPDLVGSILFSSGGFEAKYGDKMSSVLDIYYKKPTKNTGSFSASFLGGSVHYEGCSNDYRFTHISGLRYKTNQYIFSGLDTKGEYSPSFIDFQTYLTYDISDIVEISFLGNFARNVYRFTPLSRTTAFGTYQESLQLTTYFDGHERTMFNTYFGAVALNYHPASTIEHKFIISAYQSDESETFDIQGQYFLNELDKQIGSDNLGDSLMNIGVGTYLDHARNYINVNVVNAVYNGSIKKDENTLLWGCKLQYDIIDDNINEWMMKDSAEHSLPFPDTAGYASDVIHLYETTNSKHEILTTRATAYIQKGYLFDIDSSKLSLTSGIRAYYSDWDNRLLLSPRASVALKPNWDNDFVFRISGGFYYQPPFYKELRDLEGNINPDIKAQRSIHIVFGSDYNFSIWNRPFKYVAEMYYKYYDNLIPYEVEDVRIRYYGKNNAHGYAVGVDMKINGEFVPGVDSWINVSVMNTVEDIEDDYYYEYYNSDGEQINPAYSTDSIASTKIVYPGYIPRPTDQTVNFGMFFQDYFPGNPSYKMHLSLFFGSRLPFGPPKSEKYTHTLRMAPYRRVDIGFSKVLKSEDKILPPGSMFRHFKSIWLTVEVFNLLGIKNTISHLWIDDIYGRQYAVPNYLSNRRLNVKLSVKF